MYEETIINHLLSPYGVPTMAQKNVYKFSVKDGNDHTVKLKEVK